MLYKFLCIAFLCTSLCDGKLYDRYTGEVASEELLKKYEASGNTGTCTMEVADCDENERRRVDGSCNNLDHPVRGTYFEPMRRMQPGHYHNGVDPRKAADGSDLALPRLVRTSLLGEGKSNSMKFTQAMTAYQIYTFGDIGSIHDLKLTLQNKTDCCAEGMNDFRCAPTLVPEDDPVHRFSGIRCMNMTRPLNYADYGCTDDPEPAPIHQATGTFDMSNIYNAADTGDKVIRSNVGGQLTVEIDENGVIWPPSGNGFCIANQPGETKCFEHYSNTLLPVMLLGIWYMRNHNYIASELAKVNPCWDDETLFQTARDINIAFSMQVYHYDYLPSILGYENLINAGVISSCEGFRDIYDPTLFPYLSLEYTYAIRWFHTCQEASAKMYYPDGTYMKEYPMVNITFRPGFLAIDNNIVYLTQHMFRQQGGGIDYDVDPDMANVGQAYIQRSFDIMANDLHRGRYLGFAPYVDYVEMCTGHKIESYDDLEGHISPERIYQLKRIYKNYTDIDLLAGTWVENMFEGGHVPATLACIIIDHVKRAIESDRFWYERQDRPYAFTEEQLKEIRKSSLSRLMCIAGDQVSEVQPNAFLTISETNPLTPCEDYDQIDFTKWAACSSD